MEWQEHVRFIKDATHTTHTVVGATYKAIQVRSGTQFILFYSADKFLGILSEPGDER
jgi:hypothetical protein